MLKLHLSPFNIAYRTAVSVIALDASSINCLLTDILDSAPLKPIVDRPLILFLNSDPLNPMADHFLIFFSEFSSSESWYRSSLDLYLFWIQLLWILFLIISWSCSGNCFTASIRPTAWFDSLQFLVTLDIINTPIICLPVSSSRPSISILESLLAGCRFWSILLLWVLDGDLPRSPCWRYSLLDFDRAIFSHPPVASFTIVRISDTWEFFLHSCVSFRLVLHGSSNKFASALRILPFLRSSIVRSCLIPGTVLIVYLTSSFLDIDQSILTVP